MKQPIYVILFLILLAYLGGCMPEPGPVVSVSPEQSKACYAQAQAQLSPQWAGGSKLDRAVAIFSVISTCEGN